MVKTTLESEYFAFARLILATRLRKLVYRGHLGNENPALRDGHYYIGVGAGMQTYALVREESECFCNYRLTKDKPVSNRKEPNHEQKEGKGSYRMRSVVFLEF